MNRENPSLEKREDFFENIISLPVSKEEFLQMVRNKCPDMSEKEILQAKAMNIDQGGQTVILMRTDVFPEEYMPYMETHEKWEAYVARKGGYNLFNKSVREYQKDKEKDLSTDKQAYEEYVDDVAVYNYDFRHE